MNSKLMKKISFKSDVLLLEWLETLLSSEEADQVTINNFKTLLPTDRYFYKKRTLHLSAYTSKWMRKILKRLVQSGKKLDDITLEDIEHYRTSKLL